MTAHFIWLFGSTSMLLPYFVSLQTNEKDLYIYSGNGGSAGGNTSGRG